jgi:ectoine hydroxylase-related dioxygenase (phytanoyl-CoA dioxygenase family)
MGSLQYLSGSHRERPLGKHFGPRWEIGADSIYPWIMEKYEVSPAFHLQPGDALAHQLLTIHSSQPNVSADRDRLAWATQRIDANALYDGKSHPLTDSVSLVVDEPLDHSLFPIVTDYDETQESNTVRML